MSLPAKHSLLSGLTPQQLQRLFAAAHVLKLKKNAVFIQEGSVEFSFYYIFKGEVSVYKHADNHDHVLATLQAGETVGELALVDTAPRSASVKCLSDCTIYQFDLHTLNSNPDLNELLPLFAAKISQGLSDRLRSTNDVAVAALKNKFVISIFSVRMLILMSFYALFLSLIEKSKHYLPNTTLVSLLLISIFSAVVFSIIRQSGYPLKFYGITRDNLVRNAFEGIVLSLPIMALIVLIKWLVITHFTNLHVHALFDPTAIFNQGMPFDLNIYIGSMFMYASFCPLQEFIVRGCVQTSLQTLLVGSTGVVKWNAIIISNLIFASAHSHTSLGFALSVFVPGLFWGWLFYRQKSLVGVSISHTLIGVWAVFIVGFENII